MAALGPWCIINIHVSTQYHNCQTRMKIDYLQESTQRRKQRGTENSRTLFYAMACYLPSTLSFSSSLLHLSSCKNENSASIYSNLSNRSFVCCFAKKKPSFVDQILDYIEGGPKLRKWYGAPDLRTEDGSISDQEDFPEIDEVRDAVLVTNGDSEIGQMVILSLIVKRARVKALVKDKRAALEAFGTYVESISGNTNDGPFVKKALRGVRAVICPNEGFISDVKNLGGVEHVILLSQLSVYKSASGVQAMLTGNAKKLAEQDEEILISSGIPYTIIQAGSLKDTPGGVQGFNFEKGSAMKGSLSKEDAAFICVEALDVVPQTGLVFEVVNGEEKVSSWKEFLRNLIENAENQQGAQ